MTVNGNQGGGPNYEPNTRNGPVEDAKYKWHQDNLTGKTGRYPLKTPADDFTQVRAFY